jgi:hypothetical protein
VAKVGSCPGSLSCTSGQPWVNFIKRYSSSSLMLRKNRLGCLSLANRFTLAYYVFLRIKQVLFIICLTILKILVGGKHSSLFVLKVSVDEKSLFNIDTSKVFGMSLKLKKGATFLSSNISVLKLLVISYNSV